MTMPITVEEHISGTCPLKQSVVINTYVKLLIRCHSRCCWLNEIQDSNYADIILCIAFGSIKVSILLLITRIFLAVQRNVLFW